MKSNNLTLGEILAYPSQYVIPVFQRHYRWDQPQWEKLWADLAALREPGKMGRHFMGLLVLVPESVAPGQVSRYHLIDGQQRLTTLTLLLCALRDAAREAGLPELAQEIEVTTLTHQFKRGVDRYRVYPKLRDRDQYVACVDGKPAGEGRVGAAVRHFLEARGFPDTPRFEQDFVKFNLYGSRYRKAVLEALERDQEPREPADLTNAQVEHVMPQTLSDAWRADLGPDPGRIHAAWLHTPGNLTLTGYNPELHNRPFAEKRRRYEDSNVAITRDLAGHESGGEAEIEARGRRMAESAARIWPGPATPANPPVRPSPGTGGSFHQLRLRFWTEFRAYLRDRTTVLRPGKATGDSGLRVASWPGAVSLWTHANMQNGRLMVALTSRRPNSPELLRHLLAHKDEIEAEIGAPLVWEGVAKKGVLILLRNPMSPADEALWPACFDWLTRTLESFHRAFTSRLERFRNAAGKDAEGEMTSREQFLIDYWTALREHVAASHARPIRAATARRGCDSPSAWSLAWSMRRPGRPMVAPPTRGCGTVVASRWSTARPHRCPTPRRTRGSTPSRTRKGSGWGSRWSDSSH
jgi:hypothetical protein